MTIRCLAFDRGHQVRVVLATLVKTLGVGERGVKTDRKDARVDGATMPLIDLSRGSKTDEPRRGERDWA